MDDNNSDDNLYAALCCDEPELPSTSDDHDYACEGKPGLCIRQASCDEPITESVSPVAPVLSKAPIVATSGSAGYDLCSENDVFVLCP